MTGLEQEPEPGPEQALGQEPGPEPAPRLGQEPGPEQALGQESGLESELESGLESGPRLGQEPGPESAPRLEQEPQPDPQPEPGPPAGSGQPPDGAEPSSGAGEPSAAALPAELSARDRAVLDVAAVTFARPALRERAVRERLGISPTAYFQLLNALLDDPRAVAYDPVAVNRLRRERERRRDER